MMQAPLRMRAPAFTVRQALTQALGRSLQYDSQQMSRSRAKPRRTILAAAENADDGATCGFTLRDGKPYTVIPA